RHTPILATASIIDGRIFVNAKVVGAGFILKENYIDEALVKLRKHYLRGEDMDRLNYAMEGVKLLLEVLYFDDEAEAYEKVDFTKIATLELAVGKRDSQNTHG
ncbi:MAG: hypothetical protein NDF52_09040, partial [archaeon YNP-WB-062]|nr:hypothetical protein [Candidatus Culexarchaeum yellowstonense]